MARMGLSIGLGLDDYRRADNLTAINRALAGDGVGPFEEPPRPSDLDRQVPPTSYGYSDVRLLRQYYAHVIKTGNPPTPQTTEAELRALVQEEGAMLSSHLIVHADGQGYYVPIDFVDPVFDAAEQVYGGIIGSSQRLQRELLVCAAPLGIEIDSDQRISESSLQRIWTVVRDEGPFWRELYIWVGLYDATRLSIRHGLIIMFG